MSGYDATFCVAMYQSGNCSSALPRLQVNATIGELEVLRRRSESDEAAAEAAHKAAAATRSHARRLRCVVGGTTLVGGWE